MLRKLFVLLYQPYKWLFLIPVILIFTFFFGIAAVVVSSLINQKAGSYVGGALWSRFIIMLTPVFVKVKGLDNIKKGTSYIIIPNHQSFYDVFAIYGWLGLDIKWLMKKELAKIPGVGFGSRKVGHIFLDRSNQQAAVKSYKEAKRKLVNGTSVVIFPEGTRSKNGKLLPFKRGAYKLAFDLNLPLLPVTINGSKNILPAGSFSKILPGNISITVHPPIEIKDLNDKHISEIMDKSKGIISSALE